MRTFQLNLLQKKRSVIFAYHDEGTNLSAAIEIYLVILSLLLGFKTVQ